MIALADLLTALAPAGARVVGTAQATQFDGFAYDSRKVRPGELFIAVRTDRADGHDFIADAVKRGASGVLGDQVANCADTFGVTAIQVDDTFAALQAWARYALGRYAPTVVAVVGRIGKTSAAKAIVAVLSHGFADDPGVFDGDNHNTLYGLPIALGQLSATHQYAVIELAGDDPGDLLALYDLVRPTVVAVVAAFDDPDRNRELAELIERIPADGQLIVNADDPALARLLADSAPGNSARILRYGRSDASDIWAEAAEFRVDSTTLNLGDRDGARVSVDLKLLGGPAVAAGLAAATVGRALGFRLDEVAASLELLAPISGRLRSLEGVRGAIVLDDSFDAGPESCRAALDLLDRLSGPKTIVLGHLAGAGGRESPERYRSIGADVARRGYRLITVGPSAEPAALAALAADPPPSTVVSTDSAADAVAAATIATEKDTIVLVCGGSEARLERVVEGLIADRSRTTGLLARQDAGWKQRVFLSRERPTWVEVDLAAIGNNVSRLKEMARPAALMAVLKADAYGHGAVRVARTALLHGADYLATACLSEAIELRQRGINAPILILGYTPPWQAPDIVRYDLTATVFSLEPARQLGRAARALGRRPARVHIKVDTGMGRLGLLPREVPEFIDRLRREPHVEVEGIYTHFACADAADRSATNQQIARFDDVLRAVTGDGWHPRFVHASNSAGILQYPNARYSLVRAGIALYGLDPSDVVRCPSDFRPSLTLKTLVAQVKELPAGSPISYGGTYVTTRPSRIAVLPIGYGDGFRRSPRNWGTVLIRGRRAPIVGVVCMDMCMIDVTDVEGVRSGDEVVLIGRQGQDELAVADVARQLGTIPYEVITQILARVPREVAT